eukprot:3784776-Amphidinium_carterae.1
MSLRRSSRGTINILSRGNVTFASYKDRSHGSGIAFATCAIDQSAVPIMMGITEVVTPFYRPQAAGGSDVSEFYAGENVEM